MHHWRAWFRQCQTLGVDAPDAGVFVDIRQQTRRLPFELQPKAHDRVSVSDRVFNRFVDGYLGIRDTQRVFTRRPVLGQQGRGRSDGNIDAHFAKSDDVGSSDSGVEDVAYKCKLRAL